MKIFCIGFNKTGTKSLHKIFLAIGLKSVHSDIWTDWACAHDVKNLDRYDAFTDGECGDFMWLKETYPDALFFLNTRNLKNWLISRYNHTEKMKLVGITSSDNSSVESIKDWILTRNNYHKKVMGFFGEDITVIDIEAEKDEELKQKLSTKLNSKVTEIPNLWRIGAHPNLEYEYVREIKMVDDALLELNIVENDYEKIYIPSLGVGI